MSTMHFRLSGRHDGAPRSYDVCGLPGVFLLNGYDVIDRDGEEYVSVTDVEGLHAAIARHLVLTHKLLAPPEVRFIRKSLRMTQAEMAAKLGVAVQSIARWEKGQSEMPGPAEKLLRAVFLAERSAGEGDTQILRQFLRSAMDELDALDDRPDLGSNYQFDRGWAEVRVAG